MARLRMIVRTFSSIVPHGKMLTQFGVIPRLLVPRTSYSVNVVTLTDEPSFTYILNLDASKWTTDNGHKSRNVP